MTAQDFANKYHGRSVIIFYTDFKGRKRTETGVVDGYDGNDVCVLSGKYIYHRRPINILLPYIENEARDNKPLPLPG